MENNTQEKPTEWNPPVEAAPSTAPVAEKKPYHKFHPTDVKNLSVADAEKLANESRMYIRVLKEDGKELPESRDYDTERINVYVEKGIVTTAIGVW